MLTPRTALYRKRMTAGSRWQQGLPEGGRLNRAPPQERLKVDEYPIPGPGTYGVPFDPAKHRDTNARFNQDPRVIKFIRDEELRTRDMPGPGAHDVLDSLEAVKPFCPEGGRIMMGSKRQHYTDSAARLGRQTPGPASYELPGAIEPNKAAGKLVWRYQSETLKASRAMVDRLCGESHEAPGPGAYETPVVPPLAPAPTMKSRHPPLYEKHHPYTKAVAREASLVAAQGLQPDYAPKKFDPVRQHNSGDQIYGRDLRKGTAGTKSSARRSDADTVSPTHMPAPLMNPPDSDPSEQPVWKSGGFTNLRKSKSTGGIRSVRQQGHPCLDEAARRYPTLARHNLRTNDTFLPMAPKRSDPVPIATTELDRIRRKKWELAAVAEEIQAATTAALEPFDEEQLRQHAMVGLVDKAKERMRLEGISEEQQELVLAELPAVLEAVKLQAQMRTFVRTLVQGVEMEVLSPEEGQFHSCTCSVDPKIRSFKIVIGQDARMVEMHRLQMVLQGREPGGPPSPLDELCATVLLDTGDFLTFRSGSLEERETFATCLQQLIVDMADIAAETIGSAQAAAASSSATQSEGVSVGGPPP